MTRHTRPGIQLSILILFAAATGLHAYSPAIVPSPHVRTAPADTIVQSIQAGSVFITALPPAGGAPDTAYEVIQAPALSWLVDRSFFWNTRPEDAGRHLIVFRRSAGTRTDTLVLAVTVDR